MPDILPPQLAGVQQRPFYVKVRSAFTVVCTVWLILAIAGYGFFSGGTTSLALSLTLMYGTGIALLVVASALYRLLKRSAVHRTETTPDDAAAAVFLDATRSATEELMEALVPARQYPRPSSVLRTGAGAGAAGTGRPGSAVSAAVGSSAPEPAADVPSSAAKTASKPAAKSPTKTASKPAAKTAAKAASKPAAKPATKQAAKPAADKPAADNATNATNAAKQPVLKSAVNKKAATKKKKSGGKAKAASQQASKKQASPEASPAKNVQAKDAQVKDTPAVRAPAAVPCPKDKPESPATPAKDNAEGFRNAA